MKQYKFILEEYKNFNVEFQSPFPVPNIQLEWDALKVAARLLGYDISIHFPTKEVTFSKNGMKCKIIFLFFEDEISISFRTGKTSWSFFKSENKDESKIIEGIQILFKRL